MPYSKRKTLIDRSHRDPVPLFACARVAYYLNRVRAGITLRGITEGRRSDRIQSYTSYLDINL